MMDWCLAKGSLVEKLRLGTIVVSLCILGMILLIVISLALMALVAWTLLRVIAKVQGRPSYR